MSEKAERGEKDCVVQRVLNLSCLTKSIGNMSLSFLNVQYEKLEGGIIYLKTV